MCEFICFIESKHINFQYFILYFFFLIIYFQKFLISHQQVFCLFDYLINFLHYKLCLITTQFFQNLSFHSVISICLPLKKVNLNHYFKYHFRLFYFHYFINFYPMKRQQIIQLIFLTYFTFLSMHQKQFYQRVNFTHKNYFLSCQC